MPLAPQLNQAVTRWYNTDPQRNRIYVATGDRLKKKRPFSQSKSTGYKRKLLS